VRLQFLHDRVGFDTFGETGLNKLVCLFHVLRIGRSGRRSLTGKADEARA
jgi:hypothetical protein